MKPPQTKLLWVPGKGWYGVHGHFQVRPGKGGEKDTVVWFDPSGAGKVWPVDAKEPAGAFRLTQAESLWSAGFIAHSESRFNRPRFGRGFGGYLGELSGADPNEIRDMVAHVALGWFEDAHVRR